MQTTIGQALDLETGSHNPNAELFDFGQFSQENYATIVRYKTGIYSFYLPIACALYLVS